jgi:hypothetical protein
MVFKSSSMLRDLMSGVLGTRAESNVHLMGGLENRGGVSVGGANSNHVVG